MTYTSYQRVLAALEHKEPDRVPIDLGGTAERKIQARIWPGPDDLGREL